MDFSMPLLTESDIQRLLVAQPITDREPWASADEFTVEARLKEFCADVEQITGAKSRIEWDHYGSGYASFVDAWFYKDTTGFAVTAGIDRGEAHMGLVVLLSRLSPYFTFMEGFKHWHAKGGSSYLPGFDMVDRFETPAVTELAAQVQSVLESRGMARASREELEPGLPDGVSPPTIMSDPPFRFFDALYYWED
jgi:hypothetical protein